ncbi:MAG: gliding motility-associated C-terminal domain-containing protein [Bacteroidaceae bacterium]|nr:gliding motility-associated C-terminal domain-containing protein [Bacteroidaceae bacterium]
MKRYIVVVSLLLLVFSVKGQITPDRYPIVDECSATFVNHEGDVEELEIGGSYDAPLEVTFWANPTDTAGYNVLYEWKILQVKNGKETLLAKRNEESTTFTFSEGGVDVTYRIELYITYTYREDMTITGEGEGTPLTFSLRGSSVHLYNAFSPNGDGINDVYRVKTQSLLSFRMKIFNRWGQEIVSGDQGSLPTAYEDDYTYYICWDGTYHGSKVEDGVYFILVEAEGSDGVKYVRRGDINVLTRSRKEDTHE